MDRIEDTLHGVFEDDAARFRESTFAEQHGSGIAARVRRRRRAKAGGLSALGVAAVAMLSLAALPARDDAFGPADLPACLPVPVNLPDWWDPAGSGGSFLSGYGLILAVTVSEDAMELSEVADPGSSLTIPIEDHLLDGTTENGQDLDVTFPSGTGAVVSLDWTDDTVAVTTSVDGRDDSQMTFSVHRASYGLDLHDPTVRYWGYSYTASSVDGVELPTWTVTDNSNGLSAFEVTVTDDGQATVTFPDGSQQRFDAGDDHHATFDWVGATVFQILWDRDSATLKIGDDATVPVDALIVGPQYCLSGSATVSPSVSASAFPSAYASAFPSVSPSASATVESVVVPPSTVSPDTIHAVHVSPGTTYSAHVGGSAG
ncbi:hypothetical protein RN607_13480 [Demequina capsici]|uniref:Uncharacterized protein n=1 Tax=Demequina capsici TaxID=3075620 RepID=A0AA96FCW1_9MICO|nr:hypothetical protein [Demequina sp. PMTSA13]WNM27197.1 hypothetical protein RN607_13480 [Demequina sp. PMTSA13]